MRASSVCPTQGYPAKTISHLRPIDRGRGNLVRCPNCGNENPDYSVFCGRCAADLTEAKSKLQQRDVIPQPQPSPRPVAASTSSMTLSPAATSKPAPATRKCAWCGKDVNASSYVCPFCGKNPYGPWGRDNQQESMYREQASQIDYGYGMPSRPGPSGALIAGGIFAILAGVLALGQGLLYSSVSSSFASLP